MTDTKTSNVPTISHMQALAMPGFAEGGHSQDDSTKLVLDSDIGITVFQLKAYLGQLIAEDCGDVKVSVHFSKDSVPVQFRTITVTSLHESMSRLVAHIDGKCYVDLNFGDETARLKFASFSYHGHSSEYAPGSESLSCDGNGKGDARSNGERLNLYCEGRGEDSGESITSYMADEDDPYGACEYTVGAILETLNKAVARGSITNESPFRVYANGKYVRIDRVSTRQQFNESLAPPQNDDEQAALNSYGRYNINHLNLSGDTDDFDQSKMFSHIFEMADRNVLNTMWASPGDAKQLLKDQMSVATTAEKNGMTVDQLYKFLGFMKNAGLGEARIETAKSGTPLVSARAHTSYMPSRDIQVSPLNPEEVAALQWHKREKNGWVSFESGAEPPELNYSEMDALCEKMEARSTSSGDAVPGLPAA
ncbi:MAG: hypothetical protein V4451_17335 [Pseudomonadota bacterium]